MNDTKSVEEQEEKKNDDEKEYPRAGSSSNDNLFVPDDEIEKQHLNRHQKQAKVAKLYEVQQIFIRLYLARNGGCRCFTWDGYLS